jgi:hypothetical protein
MYGMIIPLVLFDISIEIYQNVCFRLYGIKIVKRSDYIRIDRHKLSKLNAWEKINCAYCGYANGLLPYSVKIASETEKYWCGIKHKEYKGHIPEHHSEFADYEDYS